MRKILGFLAALLFAAPAWATCSTVPFIFSPGTTALSGQVNANLAALVACINSISGSQITTGTIQNARLDLTTLLTALSGLPHKANNSALTATASTAYTTVIRDGFATPGDGGGATYTASNVACTLNAGAGDNGSQVRSSDGKCWLANFGAEGADFRVWGAVAGFDVTTQLQAAIAWAFSTHLPLNIPYSTALYALSSTIHIGNGTVNTYSTLNGITINVTSPSTEYAAGKSPLFNWAGPAGAVAFSVDGPIVNVHLNGLAVNCLSICATGFNINNSLDGNYEFLGVLNYTGPAFIVTSIPDNTLNAANEGNRYSDWWATVPAVGGSGLLVGAATGDPSKVAVIFDSFYNMNLIYDRSTANTYCIKLRFATLITFYSPRCVPGDLPGVLGNSLVIAPPAGSTAFPSDIKIVHPSFQGDVLDPGGAWTATQGVEFDHWGTTYTAIPSSARAGAFYGTDDSGTPFGAPTRKSWTPTVIGSVVAGTTTYTTQVGSYVKIGGLVTATFNVAIAALGGGAAGTVVIAGLPVATSNNANDNGFCTMSLWAGLTLDANFTMLAGYIAPNSATINIVENGTAGVTFTAMPVAKFAGATSMFGQCTYWAQ